MRPIKFRAWIKDTKVMDYNPTINGTDMTSVYLNGFFPDCDFWELTQFTGLLDKNGKEIYEGDIVQNQAHAKREVRRTKSGEYKLYIAKHSDSFLKGWSPGTVWEIIGNIYENGDLLDAEQ